MKLHKAPFPLNNMDPRHVAFVMEYLRNGFSAMDAAIATNFQPDDGNKLLKRPDVECAINHAVVEQYNKTVKDYDHAWVLEQLVENHYQARQKGNIAASNSTLNTIAKLSTVDAFSPERMILSGDQDRVDVLNRSRKRLAAIKLDEPQAESDDPDFSVIE